MTPHDHPGHGSLSLLLAFAGGALAGGVVAMLLAPRSGAATRRRLADAVGEGREMASRVPDAFREASTAARSAFSEAMKESS